MIDENKVRDWFAQEVRERMEDAGLAAYHVAYYCQMGLDHIYRYLQGKPFPKTWNLILLAECLDCSVNDLLGFDELGDINSYERLLASKTYLGEYEFSEHFRNRLIRCMNEADVSAEELKKRTGIGKNALEEWLTENRFALPNVLNILHIADALDCTPSDLLGY